MKKFLFIISLLLLFVQCDDGDFDTPSFVFENNIDHCGNLIIFNVGVNDSEALILDLNFNNTNNIFFTTARDNEEFDLNNEIFYRVFDGNVASNYFCQNIPPTSPNIVNEWNGSGILIVNNIIVLDDKDGVEEIDETLDTDLDNFFDYIDIDDDNDGVLTSNEINNDGSFIDTDGDSIPNHLDADDDGDSIPTLNELITDSNGDTILDYLDNTTTINQTQRLQITNTYNLNYTTSFVIENMSLNNQSGNAINFLHYEYGVKTGDISVSE